MCRGYEILAFGGDGCLVKDVQIDSVEVDGDRYCLCGLDFFIEEVLSSGDKSILDAENLCRVLEVSNGIKLEFVKELMGILKLVSDRGGCVMIKKC